MSPNVGDRVLVATAQERRHAPRSDINWYDAEILKIGERNAERTVYVCRVAFHADKGRGIFVRNASPETPTEEWDAIRPANVRKDMSR